MRRTVMGLVLFALSVTLIGMPTATTQAERAARLGEWGLRQHATTAPMPEYPPDALKQKVSGVVVAAVRFGSDGRSNVEILESPNPQMGDAVRYAVSRWTVPGMDIRGQQQAYAVQGKLTFYFQIRNGKGRVLDPDQMPGGRPRPVQRSGVPVSSSGQPDLWTPQTKPPASVHGSHGETLKTITVEAFRKQQEQHVVLDFGERHAFKRGHWPGAFNIPLDELAVRGGPELPREKLIAIDCTQEDMQMCRLAGGRLVEQQFAKVVLLVR